MIRIMTADNPTCTTITVDGKLSGDYVETIETCCAQAASKGRPVQLYLRDVSIIDEPARGMLHRLAGKGVGLKATGIYSSYVVAGIMSGRQANGRNRGMSPECSQ